MFIKEELSLATFEAWQGGADTLATIIENDKVGEAEDFFGELFPEGATRTQVNDVLWFDGDLVLEALGIEEE